jgi:hypothetical protein
MCLNYFSWSNLLLLKKNVFNIEVPIANKLCCKFNFLLASCIKFAIYFRIHRDENAFYFHIISFPLSSWYYVTCPTLQINPLNDLKIKKHKITCVLHTQDIILLQFMHIEMVLISFSINLLLALFFLLNH